jgi:hypothetical protein
MFVGFRTHGAGFVFVHIAVFFIFILGNFHRSDYATAVLVAV